MTPQPATSGAAGGPWRRTARHRLLWPALVLFALLLGNLAFHHDFLSVRVRDGHLYGSPVDILRFGAPLVLVALGMTLVIATRGIDLSVGSTVAIAGALACGHLSTAARPGSVATTLTAVALALGVALVLGLANGLLVSGLRVQPIVATLILMVAGRGVAQLITDGQIITVTSAPYKMIGGGYWLLLPFAVLLAAALVALTAFVTRRSALGMLIESVGGNPTASRLVGIRAGGLLVLVYVFSALCAAVAGLMISSNVSSADGNNAGLWIELDAILAVVVGGTALTGGRFSLGGTVLGALIIQTLSTTVYTLGVPPETTLVFKAFVVVIVCLVQSPVFRARVMRRRAAAPRSPATAGTTPQEQEVRA
ncbi:MULTISPECIES: ABC transporter permease [Streptomyces]|uniref:ABC transporter permease n=1 Tax=Streptomyces TaxID=1883 RepID=UPI000F7726E6|nr:MULTISPECIES: ABC transporter permease [Streptomyces]RST06890.1 ABC transporter permease [Streptomyces sp. WAC07149]GLX17064.1 sugar ABC transporter permease [Streptomyces lavendulae subsp. lavendulae]GLX29571.1 sugar ABC transporter permease [Streptomyces lavendulae subsp. lavendulae]